MKVYKKIVYDKNDNIIEEDSYEYNGPIAEAKGGGGIGGVIGGIIGAITKPFKKIFKAITNFVGDVFGFLVKPFSNFGLPNVDPEMVASGVKIQKPGTNIGIPIVYGFRRVGSIPIFAETNGTDNTDLYVVFAICEGEIHGIRKIFIDGRDIGVPPSDASYWTHGTTYSGENKFKDRLQFQLFYGTEDQGQSSLANGSKTWPSKQRKLPGIAYGVFKFIWKSSNQDEADTNPYGGGIPQIEFDVLGKKVYNVVNHAGGEDLANDYADLPKQYSTNPANCFLDYLMNPRYGAGYDKSFINADSFKVAGDKFNQSITYEAGFDGPILTTNCVINPVQKIMNNAKVLLGGCRSMLPYIQGRYKLKVEDGGNATDIMSSTISIAYDVDKDNLVGGVTLSGETKNTKYNQVIVNYVDPSLDFSSQQVFYNVSGDKVLDDNEDLTGEFTFETITNKAIAKDFARMIYDKSRKQRQISFVATQELMDVEVSDIIRVTDEILDISSVTFRIIGMSLNLEGTVSIEAVEHDTTLYPHITTPQTEVPPPLYLPDAYYNSPRQGNRFDPYIGYMSPVTDSAGSVVVPSPPTPPPSPSPTQSTFHDVGTNRLSDGVRPNATSFVTNHAGTMYGNNYTHYFPFGGMACNILSKTLYKSEDADFGPTVGTTLKFEGYKLYLKHPSPTGTIKWIEVNYFDIKTNNIVSRKRFVSPGLHGVDRKNHAPVLMFFCLNENFGIKIRYIDDTGAGFLSGGDISAWHPTFSSYTSSYLGVNQTGTGLEAFLNWIRETGTFPDGSRSAHTGGYI